MNKKIFSSKKIKEILSLKRRNKKKIGLCHGVFDLLHIGHIKHFKKAKEFVDFLVVSITSDRFVNKGSDRPIFKQQLRIEALASLEYVDAVILSDNASAQESIKIVKPNFYFKGVDYKNNNLDVTGKIKVESNLVKKYGGKVIYTNETASSSTFLINKYNNIINDEQKNYLKSFKKNFSFQDIIKYTNKIKNLKVLVIGETIIDQYIFCEVLGKSGKESYLNIKEILNENHLGGAAAVAKHLSTFCNGVTLLSMIGENKDYENFIKNKLGKSIKTNFIYKKGSPTIVKKRYIDNINKNKLIGVYNINDQVLDNKENNKLIKNYKKIVRKFDLVIISDYGHGFITKKFTKVLEKYNYCTYLNAQINAANIGYHSIRKYKKINGLIINETELRHEMRDKIENIANLAKDLQTKININKIVVTRGKLGAIMINKKNKKVLNCPAFAQNVVDKVGAGDTMLSMICLFLKVKAPDAISLFMGSLAGAASVEIMGNSSHLSKQDFLRQVQTTLK